MALGARGARRACRYLSREFCLNDKRITKWRGACHHSYEIRVDSYAPLRIDKIKHRLGVS